MSSPVNVVAVDLLRFRSLLGSGEEAFCAKVLRTIPGAAERLGLGKQPDLVKAWSRGVTGIVLGDAGETLAEGRPLNATADLATSLAFASVLAGFATEGLGGSIPAPPVELLRRPLFGLSSEGTQVRWGWLASVELREVASHPVLDGIRARGLDAVGLSGSLWR